MTTPAFKEWHTVVHALETGRQTLLLRKGGIHEGPQGFQLEAKRFWLFPTRFHTEAAKVKADAWVPLPTPSATLTLSSVAELAGHTFLDRWEDIQALASLHIWTEDTVRERFEWDLHQGVHLLLLRVSRVTPPVSLPLAPEFGGCRSWVDLPLAWPAPDLLRPVLAEETWQNTRRLLQTVCPRLR